MFLDASAIVAILLDEPMGQELIDQIDAASSPILTSPLARFEAVVSLARALSGSRKPTPALLADVERAVDAFAAETGAKEVAIDGDVGRRAVRAAQTYGKTVGHPADLNFGDCFAYACAKAHDVPLLYTGQDFAKTDLG